METKIIIPYRSIFKEETIITSEPQEITDKGSYISVYTKASVVLEEEDEDMGIKTERKIKYDGHRRVFKNQINNLETFLCNKIKKYCVNIEYGNNGATFAFDTKDLAEDTAEKLMKMILNK